MAITDVVDRAVGYGMPGVIVDGMDVVAIYEAASEAVARARRGDGPSMIEAKTYRFYNHHGVQNLGLKYRTDDEVAVWKERDPIFSFEERLIELGTVDAEQIEQVWAELRADIDEAIAVRRGQPVPRTRPVDGRRLHAGSAFMSERKLSYVMAFNEAVRQAMEADPDVFCAGEDIGAFGGVFGTFGGLQSDVRRATAWSTRRSASRRSSASASAPRSPGCARSST